MTNETHTSGHAGHRNPSAELSLDAFPYTTVIATRWKDNDVYGHVNNVEYYSYFDTVINEVLIGQGGLDINGGEVIAVCAESGCRFLASLSFPGRVAVGLSVSRLGHTSVRYEIALFNDQNRAPAAEGFFVHVFVSREGRRPTPVPPSVRAALARLAVTAQ